MEAVAKTPLRWVSVFLQELGAMTSFVGEILRIWRRAPRGSLSLILEQVGSVGVRSVATICFAGFFVGAILVIQFQLILMRYDASSLLGALNTSAMMREVGPLIISFLLAGKVGAYTAAELGTMRVTEQVDAIRCLGTNPIQYLVLPRFVAIVICSLLLLVFGIVVGVLGSMVVANLSFGMNMLQFMESMPRFVNGWTIFGGIFKSFVYGVIVATVCTYKGYTASGGARGVGVAVTETSIYTNLFIVLANSFTSFLLENAQAFVHATFHGGVG